MRWTTTLQSSVVDVFGRMYFWTRRGRFVMDSAERGEVLDRGFRKL